jgi:hypothetical protein
MPSCCIVGCKNRTKLHVFPKDKCLREQWIKACGHTSDWTPRADERICSEHFSPSDLKMNGRAKDHAVPQFRGRYILF